MSHKSSLLQVHAAVVLFGLAGLFGKWLALAPVFIVLGRVLFGSLALASVLLLTGRRFRVRSARDGLLFLLLGFILALHWVLFFRSIQVSSVAVGLLSYASFPVFTVFLEPVFFNPLRGIPRTLVCGGIANSPLRGQTLQRLQRVDPTDISPWSFRERLDRLNILMAGLCVIGILLIVPRFDLSDATVRGLGYGLGAGLTFAILTLINKLLTFRYGSLEIAFGQDLTAVLFLCPFLLTARPVLSARTLVLLAVLGLFCTALAHTLFIGSMRRIKAQTAAIISSLEPVYGMAAAALFLGERWPLRTILGGAVILGATLAVSLRARSRGA